MNRGLLLILLCLLCGLSACRRTYIPKPYGYFRIEVPDTAYSWYKPEGIPCTFRLSDNAQISARMDEGGQKWFNIDYLALNATIHCTYLPIDGNLRTLLQDMQDFLFSHSRVATAIPGQEYQCPAHHVWGVYYDLQGDVASPLQFSLTDSVAHFFRGSVYCNTIPNQDSLAPVYDYLRHDVRVLIESLRWRNEK